MKTLPGRISGPVLGSMGRSKSAGRVELAHIFQHMQRQMLTQLAAGDFIDQPTSCGAITEQHWLDLFRHYLPQRYCAIYDRLYSPLLFPNESGLNVPAEAVDAVFEVKHQLTAKWIRDAGRKAASVRRLRRTSVSVVSAEARSAYRHFPGILLPSLDRARRRAGDRIEVDTRRAASPLRSFEVGAWTPVGATAILRGESQPVYGKAGWAGAASADAQQAPLPAADPNPVPPAWLLRPGGRD